MTRALVTGGAGFIRDHLAARLLADGAEVVVYDNFSTGQRRARRPSSAPMAPRSSRVTSWTSRLLTRALASCDVVFHLAANADVRFGLEDPGRTSSERAGHLRGARGDEGERDRADRLRVQRSFTASQRCSRHRRRAVSGADVALRRLELAAEG